MATERMLTLCVLVVLAACTSTAPKRDPIERVDEGIYRIGIVGGQDSGITRHEVAAAWVKAARAVCQEGYTTIEERDTAESSDTVGWNVLGLPVSPGGTKTVSAKSGYVRCDDSPYGIADATFIVRDVKTVITLPLNLAACPGVNGKDPVALRMRGAELAAAHDDATAFGCFYRAASFGKDFRDGDPEAQFEVARRYERGDGTSASPMLALTWYRRAAVNGHAGAAFRLSELAPQ